MIWILEHLLINVMNKSEPFANIEQDYIIDILKYKFINKLCSDFYVILIFTKYTLSTAKYKSTDFHVYIIWSI